MLDFKLISADGHINEPPAAWERVQKEYGDRAPKVVKDPEGFKGIWVMTDGLPPSPCSNYSIGHVVSKPEGIGNVDMDTHGHHPHLIQPIEVYKGKTIFYSLANFVHDGALFWGKEQHTLLARCRIGKGQIGEVSFVPGRINKQNQPVLMKPAEAAEVVNHVREVSDRFGTCFDVSEDEVVIRSK
jgi:hypothetical protein